MPTEKDDCTNKIDYEAEYHRLKAKTDMLEVNNKKLIAEYESELDKRLEEAKENRKLKTIIAKILEEKYLSGDK